MPRTKSATTQRRELEDKLACVQLESQLAVVKQGRSLLEATGWGDIVPRDEYPPYDDPTFTNRGYGKTFWQTSIRDRVNGDCVPIYETEQELAAIRAEGRTLSIFASIGIGAIQTLTNYVIGSGYKFKVQAASGFNPESASDLIGDVQGFVDKFLDENNIVGQLDRDTHEQSRVDGERLLGLYPGFVPRVGVIEPDCLREPIANSELERWVESKHGIEGPHFWKYGVHTIYNPHMQRNDTLRPIGYHVVYDEGGNDWDYLPAARVIHIKRNVPLGCKRGVSDFVGITEEIADDKKLGRNTAKGAAIQAAIAYFREHAQGSTQAGIQAVVTGNATTDYQQTIKTGSRTRKVETLNPGTVRDIPSGMVYRASMMGDSKSPIFIQVMQAVQRRIGVRWAMSEGMISGDYSNNALASQLVAEGPFVKAREVDQSDTKRWLQELVWKALLMAFQTGRFARHQIEWEQLESVIEIKIDAPKVASRDRLQQAQTNEIESRAGVLSPRTWAAETDRDYDEEVKSGAKKQEPASPFGSPAQESILESFADCCGQPTGSANVKVARDGTVKLSQPMSSKDASAMLQALNRLHAVIMSDAKEAATLPALHPDRVAADERAHAMPGIMARAIRMTRPILRESQGGAHTAGRPFVIRRS